MLGVMVGVWNGLELRWGCGMCWGYGGSVEWVRIKVGVWNVLGLWWGCGMV